jgi:hypothetical protein
MRPIAILLFAALAAAQTRTPTVYVLGTTPKAKAADYDAHAKLGDVEIGAEFMVRSFSRGEAMYIARDYVTVEVALYAPKDKPLEIGYLDFQLSINEKKQILTPQNPQTVAMTLDHPDWQQERPGWDASAGAGNGRVTLGGPPHTPLPGGDPPGTYPQPTRIPKPDPPGGVEPQARASASQIAVECALPDATQRAPVSGFLYFAYSGNTKSIKSVVLRYRDAELKLR